MGILFRQMYQISKKTLRLNDNPMVKGAVKVLFYKSKTRGESQQTQALPKAYYRAVVDFLNKQKGNITHTCPTNW